MNKTDKTTWKKIATVLENNGIEALSDPDGVFMNYHTDNEDTDFEFMVMGKEPEQFISRFQEFSNEFDEDEYATEYSKYRKADKNRLKDAKQIKKILKRAAKELRKL